ncbi:hypothetical protein F8M41_021908 [Gigaspora margarita]|uniref:Uncharacterized protein n=1 Tax=Gigaspora margarita TaxID=4874 RepID=A0A8H4ETW4_GIGMA|nr:hypothetical protein F8M41_021908 [Gigaspora margarita]
MQIAISDNEPEIEQQLTSIFKRYTMMSKENIDLTFRPSNNDNSESFGSNFYKNCDGSTSNTYETSNYITPASNRYIISTSSNYETPAFVGYIDSTSDSDNEM